jgi:Yip1 domain
LRTLPPVLPTEQIRPLRDVWLRPRRVFRELATQPIGIADYFLAAAQGIATSIMVYRTQMASAHVTATEILGSALVFGPLGGIVSIYLFAAIYGRLAKRVGAASTRNRVFHVLAYGGLPVAASLLVWAGSALLIGEVAITDAPLAPSPGADIDGFVAFVLRAQTLAYLLLSLWSVLLQVMGLSEVLNLLLRKAFGVWVLGQFLALLMALFLSVLIALLFPGLAPATH